ncbi:MAG TPA: hypothetical protein VFC19_51840 [Candidatus Limnocylindrales bacterium]|nr:hypothetical protein [Candidatus Limnocylindrales bacterium]
MDDLSMDDLRRPWCYVSTIGAREGGPYAAGDAVGYRKRGRRDHIRRIVVD